MRLLQSAILGIVFSTLVGDLIGQPAPPTFYRAINIGGPAMVMDGRNWEADPTGNFTANGTSFTYPQPGYPFNPNTFNPSVDTAHKDMLRSFRFTSNLQFSMTGVPSGVYDVYVWAFEDSGPLNATLFVEGNAVTNYTSGPVGKWDRLGPYRVTVSDGNIQVRFQCNSPAGDAGNISGLEVWQVITPLVITSQPASASVMAGISASFSVSASGSAPSYQWRLNGSPIGGATSSSYTIASAQATDAGNYDVVVSNSAGSVTSVGAALTVITEYVSATSLLSVNGHHFVDSSGGAVYLTGSHTWINMQDFSGLAMLDFGTYLNFLQGQNHNFIRLWQWDEPDSSFFPPAWGSASPLPWARTGPGNASDGGLKYDLGTFDQRYFDRLRDRVAAADARGIYVSVMLHNGWWSHSVPNDWSKNQFNPANNINGYAMDLSSVYTLSVSAWLGYMTNYAHKVVDTLNGFNNVLYEIGNEMPEQSLAYQNYLISVIKSYEATMPKQHPVGMTSFGAQDFAAGPVNSWTTANGWLTSSSADWISPGGPSYGTSLPMVTGNQVQILDSDHVFGVGGSMAWVWKSFARGYYPIYMDPYGVAGMGDANSGLRAALGHTKHYADYMHLAGTVPSLSVASTGYCLTNSLLQYLVYSTNRSSFNVALPSGSYVFEWFNPQSGTVVLTNSFNNSSSGNVNFTPPSGIATDSVLYIAAQAPSVVTPPVITSHPASVSVTAGNSANFSVSASGSAPSYQWRLNGSPIGGATSSNHTLASAQPTDAGNYDVAVSNSAGAVTSVPASLTVLAPLGPPEVRVLVGANNITDGQGAVIDFGSISRGDPGPSLTFSVINDGGQTLTLGAVSVPEGYTLTETLAASLAPGARDTFTVRLDSAAIGIKSGTLSFSNNDSDENPFNFSIGGQVALPPPTGTFYRAINVGGPALTIEGNNWEADPTVDFTASGASFTYPDPGLPFDPETFNPVVDTVHKDMLRSFRFDDAHPTDSDLQISMTKVPNGTYDVYVWTFEDDAPLSATLSVEGSVVGTYNSGPAGYWDRLGPFQMTVSDGDIQVRFQCATGQAFISGLEVWWVGAPPPTETFYRAINVGGPALTIDGRNWEADPTGNFTANGTRFTYPQPGYPFNPNSFSPSVGTPHKDMLRSFRFTSNLQFSMTGVPSGVYDVYVWAFEDSGPLNATLFVEGNAVTNYTSGPVGKWDRLGPYRVTVSDGNIQVRFQCNSPAGDAGNISGLEVWQVEAAPPPPATFYRAINVGGPALTIDGHNWEADPTGNFTTSGTISFTYPQPGYPFDPNTFSPSVDTVHKDMLRSFRYGVNPQFTMSGVPNGVYDVYVWTFEDSAPLNATLFVEGNAVANYTSGPAGRWDRLGPYQVTVSDGNIQVRFQCNTPSDADLISGIEVWQ